MPVAGEFERDCPVGRLPCRMVVQMTDQYRDAPIVGNRLVQVIVPHSLVVCRASIRSGELIFQGPVVADKLIQSV